jgi:hypothetical protein
MMCGSREADSRSAEPEWQRVETAEAKLTDIDQLV